MRALFLLILASPAAMAQTAQVPAEFAGTWQLSPEKSDDLSVIADFLKIDATTRWFAPKRPEQTISVAGSTLTIQGSRGNPETFILDGKTATPLELFTAKGSVTAQLEGSTVVLRGTLVIDGAPHSVVSRRSVVGDELTSLTVFDGPSGVSFKRVFLRRKGATR